MIILGIILILLAIFVSSLHFLYIIGAIILIIGIVLAILGAMGRAVGGRKHYY